MRLIRSLRGVRGGGGGGGNSSQNDPIRTRPTESESEDGDEELEDANNEENQSFQSSDDSVSFGIPIPTEYLLHSTGSAAAATSPSPSAAASSRSPSSSNNNNNPNNTNSTAKRKARSCLPLASPTEQRLIMMAKHPGMSVSSDEAVAPSIHDYEHGMSVSSEEAVAPSIQDYEWKEQQQQQQQASAAAAKPKSNKNNTSVNFDAAGPVDADTGDAWVANDNSKTFVPWEETPPPPGLAPSSSSSTTTTTTSPWDRLVAWFYYRPLDAGEGGADSQDCAASKQSMSVVSDQTPRVSNVTPQKKRKMAVAANGAASTTTTPQSWFQRIISTRSGVVILCLVVILFLAIIVTVAAAVASSNKRDKNSADSTIKIVPGPMVPRSPTVTATTLPPTSAPTSAPTIHLPSPSSFPSVSPTTTASPTTTSPTLTPITPSPTSTPTLPGASAAPTPAPTPGPTRFPTLAPTPRPTRRPTPRPTPLPTLAPTPNPTARPTTRSPTLRPTTAPPTSSPTTQFDNILLQPLETLLGSQNGQRFGYFIALSQDGTILAVGAPGATMDGKDQAGMVQVYRLRLGIWVTRGPAVVGRNAGDQFGSSVSLSSDGSVLAVGAPTFTGVGNRSGNVRVFVYGPSNQYELLGNEIAGLAATDHFGAAVALSQNGRRVAVGAPYHDNGNGTGSARLVSGQLQVYEFNTANSRWNAIASFQGTGHLDWFGWSVDIANTDSDSADESSSVVVCAGAPRNIQYGGYVTCYTDRGGTWRQLGKNALRNDIAPVRYDDSWGNALSISQDGNRVAIGSPGKNGASGALNTGMVAVYDYDVASNDWKLLGPALTLHNAPKNQDSFQFGSSLDLVGSVVAVGSPGLGQADLYAYQAGQWQPHSQSWKSNDTGRTNSNYGYAIQLSPTYTLAVASAATDGLQPGSVNVYKQP